MPCIGMQLYGMNLKMFVLFHQTAKLGQNKHLRGISFVGHLFTGNKFCLYTSTLYQFVYTLVLCILECFTVDVLP